MNRKEIISLLILLAVIIFGLYRFITRSYTAEKSQYLMDTIVRISATSKSKDVSQKIDQVFEYIKQIETDLNEYKEGGWLWQVNNSSNYKYDMQPDAYELLVLADSLYRFTGGRFDITIKPVFDLWQFSSAIPQLPDSMLIKKTLKQTGFDRIRYNQEFLYKPSGMQLTFGALAKGYIMDKAREYMLSLDLYKGYIDCHSSMTFFGNRILPEIVGIQHPRKMNDIIATLQIRDNSIGTSGDYQQFFDVDSTRYHHILDARTGYPVKDVYSVTVLNPSALMADGLSTAIFVMDPEQAVDLIKLFPGSEVIVYYRKNGSIMSLKSQGIKSIIQSEQG
ncbi:MAG: FAD:protein FMN transferase [Candidatus Cloacimonadaceae bacterium]